MHVKNERQFDNITAYITSSNEQLHNYLNVLSPCKGKKKKRDFSNLL